ncbi:transcriptional regulator domain-containing protein [Novosphingobium marinum]|uniref:transcriptional regulator domain-containing protein n=1 Tax=Novosphingobium marinum TaxID=1514948 RepID=UPI003570AFC8
MARPSDGETQFGELDLCDFAQEFLRRNNAYRRAFDQTSQSGISNARTAASRRMARTWGLEFPDRSQALVE